MSTSSGSASQSRSHSASGGGRPNGRRRPSEFTLPDGRKVLVALPSDAEKLRRKYSATGKEAAGEPAMQVEVVVHGSDEHTNLLHKAKEHRKQQAEEMKRRIGHQLLEEWDSLKVQIAEMERMMERAVDHSSRLNANFEKFGFDAQLRTFGDELDEIARASQGDEEGGTSGGSTLNGSGGRGGDDAASSSSGTDWSERRGGTTVKLYKKPVIKQYFHRGLLWRSSEEMKVMSFELFFDLLYVGVIAINGDNASEEANGHALVRFVITFGMSWKIWNDVQQFVSWFDSDDVVHRVEIVFLIACLLGLTTNTLQTFNEHYDTYSQLVGWFLTARLFISLHAAYVAFMLPLVKAMMVSQIMIALITAALLIASIYVEMPNRLALTFTALAVDLFGSSVHVLLFRYGRSHNTKFANKITEIFDFYPAMNIEHKVERTNAFVTLVLGYSVVGVLFQNTGFGLSAFVGKAILGLVQAFVFNWLYFEVDGTNIHVHAIRRHVNSAFLWQHAHLTFIMSFILASAALSKLVVAADCPDSPAETLTDFYHHRSEEHVSIGLRLYYCIGLAIALLSMALISLSHEHKLPLTCRLPKWVRLANRLAVCVILFCLPAAQELNSLNLIAITTCLTVWVLLFEVWGKSCPNEAFWGEDKACCYTARCSKKELEDAINTDGEVDVVELGKSEKTGAVDLS